MIKLGITGGIGSGKSTVSHILERLGIPVYIADDRAKVVMLNHPAVKRDLIALLGADAYLGNQLNKKCIGEYLFANPANAKQINSIVHPRVKEDIYNWYQSQSQTPVVAMESAILFDAHFEDTVDYTVLVYAPQDLRVQRVIKRDHSTVELVLKRMEAQLPESKKIELADFLILNDAKSSLIEQVYSLSKHLKKFEL